MSRRRTRLEAVWFGVGGIWADMAIALQNSAEAWAPRWHINVQRVSPRRMRSSAIARPSHVANTQKMLAWARAVREARDGDRLLLIDADTLITGPLDDVWDARFDVAYTTKNSRFPFNSGVVFLRVNERSRKFVDSWERVNRRMLSNAHLHQPWRQKYGGINQASLGRMIELDGVGARMRAIPCEIWNCEDSNWDLFDPGRTRIVHFKSALRRALHSPAPLRRPTFPQLVALWRQARHGQVTTEQLAEAGA